MTIVTSSHTQLQKISEILNILQTFKDDYLLNGEIQILVVNLILIYLILLDHI